MESKETKFFSLNLVKILSVGSIWYIFFIKGFSEFFVRFGVAPVDTVSELIGGLIIPIIPTYFFARYLHNKKGNNFLYSWMIGLITVCVISTIGMLNGKNHWW